MGRFIECSHIVPLDERHVPHTGWQQQFKKVFYNRWYHNSILLSYINKSLLYNMMDTAQNDIFETQSAQHFIIVWESWSVYQYKLSFAC